MRRTTKQDLAEINFALYLDEIYGEDVTQGVTTFDVRRDRARALILRNSAADRVVAKNQTMAQAFAKVYGEPLVRVQMASDAFHENGDGV